ncbi:MAG: efflux RND transporter permease subunit [Myxococcota bacterium]
MIARVVQFALRQPLFTLVMVLLFVGAGMFAFANLPIEAFPDVSDTQVQVITLYPGRAPEEVEKQVTIPLEIALSAVPHAVRVFSHTQFGLSFIVLTFDDKVDDYFARARVQERLTLADLPPNVEPNLAPLATAIGELYRYRLKGDGWSPRDLRSLEDWVVERYLKHADGVADIVSQGGSVKQYEVHPDMGRLKGYGITLEQLFAALERGNANAGGSYVDRGSQQYLIRGIGMLRSGDDIERVVVSSHGGTPVLVRDVAEVSIGAVPRQGIVGQDDDDDIVNGIVLMRKGENPSRVLESVKEQIKLLNTKILPQGVQVTPYYDRTWLIDTTLHTVFHNLAEGAMLVTLVLYLFLGNFRAAAIVALVIPLALLSTFLGLTWRGIPANLLSLGAMDFGIIVDGAVIVVENVFRKLAARGDGADRETVLQLVQSGAVEVGRPTFFSMLIIIAAHLPIFTLQRHEGRIFAPMAWTVTSALVGSLIFSLTLVPLLCSWFLRSGIAHEENALVRACHRVYEPALHWALARRRLVVALAAVALFASLGLASRLGTEFLPELNEGTIWVNTTLPPGVSLDEARALCRRMREILRKTPEVRSTISKAGRPEDGTDPKTLNMVETFVDLYPQEEWKRGLSKADVIHEMDANLAVLPGLEITFSQPIRDNVLESISQIDGQVVVKVFGDDVVQLHASADAILHAVRGVRGVARAFVDRAGEVPQIVISIDRDRAGRYGLDVQDIQDVIETALGGKVATQLWEGEKHFGVALRLRENERAAERLKDVLLDTPDGGHVPLLEVAEFRETEGAMNISRENGTRVASIGVFIEGRDMGSVVADMQEKVRGLDLGQGTLVTWSGEFENQERAMKRLSLIVPVSVFIIFILLFNAFNSIRSALLILGNVPFALIGGIVALFVTGIPLSVSAAIGFIALFGQAVLNGVVMVSCFNDERATGKSALEAVLAGARVRLRTVLMTALLAMLGLLPMALSHGIGAETQRPLAIVIIGGLISATALTLIVLPVLYLVAASDAD